MQHIHKIQGNTTHFNKDWILSSRCFALVVNIKGVGHSNGKIDRIIALYVIKLVVVSVIASTGVLRKKGIWCNGLPRAIIIFLFRRMKAFKPEGRAGNPVYYQNNWSRPLERMMRKIGEDNRDNDLEHNTITAIAKAFVKSYRVNEAAKGILKTFFLDKHM